ncbi:50S ribosomal protein L33 [Roseobacter sp. SK209-2-6]|uniref:GNAT family N-acetyltransferase n=1 Tax=Roseobacter sp. SK209-2-6 TaxID=388739 RepID=UPI0000F3F209|nr:50S ribosomal protein L33 [Roseobacter sp. SK209-2-6]
MRAQETRLMIHHLTVHSPFQRMRVSTALITEVKKYAISLDVSSIVTSYAPFNAHSAALFSRLGLEPVLTFAEWRP